MSSVSENVIPVSALALGVLLLVCAVKNVTPLEVMKNIASGNVSGAFTGGTQIDPTKPAMGSPTSSKGINLPTAPTKKKKGSAYPGGPPLSVQ